MKKRLGAALIVAMVSLLSACGTKSAPAPSAETGQKGTGAGAAETAGTETAGAEADGTKGADGEIHAPLQETPDLLLRLSEDQSIDYPTTMGCLRFADLVYERTNGRIKVEVYDSGTLGNTTAVIEQLQYGAIDLCRCGVGDLSQFSPRLSLFTLPFLFTNTENYYKCMDSDLAQEILEMADAEGLIGMCYYTNGSRSFYSSKPLTGLGDLKGQVVRTQESALMMGLMDALGADPTPVAYAEVYSALQTGVVDAAENSVASYASTAHYEVAPNLMLDCHVYEPDLLIMSQQIWDELSPEDQEILRQAAQESVVYEREIYEAYEAGALKNVVDAGVVVTELTPEKQQEFMDATASMAEAFCGDYIQDVETLRRMQD
ncbi:MAG: TRAP transporter substrate-binding protein [Lachnospiraceae bacterium]|nr:TRAP transporter substrate-binding protein [Lachnospiraceae bacterium]